MTTTWREDWQALRQQGHWKSIVVLLSAAVLLLLQHYVGTRQNFLGHWLAQPGSEEMAHSLSWCALVFTFYFVGPALLIKFLWHEKLQDYGFSLLALRSHWKIYALFYICVLPLILLAARTSDFQKMYPFFKYVAAGGMGLLIWELAYGMQFFAVEFFFRGYLLFGLQEKFGYYSILIMTVPYCMIHFPKLAGESVGAIIAGIVLGYLALKSRSIWGGVLLHWGVAVTMDVASLLNRG